MRNSFGLAFLVLTLAGCGGEVGSDGESGDPFTIVNRNCQAFNPGYISLDSVTAPAWELFGEPAQLGSSVTAHQVWSGSGPSNFPHGVVYDGISVDERLNYAWSTANGTVFQPTSWWSYGRIVDGSTPDNHTVSVTSVCGTESRTVHVGKSYATAPKPSLTIPAGLGYVYPATAVPLGGAITRDATSCAASRAHLVGKEEDGTVVVDQTIAGNVNFFTATVKPKLTTNYTLTTYCTLASYATPQSTTAHVQVYVANSVCPAGESLATWAFCQTCPASFDWETPWTSPLTETACTKDEARQMAQSMGTNCTLSDGACS